MYRIDLSEMELITLQRHINELNESYIPFVAMKQKVNNPKEIEWSHKKSLSAYKATEARTAKAKEKIQNAINILRMENKKITHYSIAKTAEVSYLTVKKYISLDEIN